MQFQHLLQRSIARARRAGKALSLFYIDIDHFQEINDSLGHPVGDELLKAVVDRITSVIRSNDLLARLGGDEFALIQQDIDGAREASVLAAKIIAAVDKPFDLRGSIMHTSVSIGITLPQGDTVDTTRLMSYADVAMYKAKDAGRGTYAFFEDDMTHKLHHEMQLFEQLRLAEQNGELFLLYQPQYELDSGHLVGVEALLRWRNPQLGVMHPASFLPIAERRGLIRKLSAFALAESCRQARTWQDAGLDFGHVAVNLCASQVNAEDFYEVILSTVADYGIEPTAIEFEFTETTLMESTPRVRKAINSLADAGFRFAIDDFGTGFASFSYLRDFHADKLKIGSDFIAKIPGGEKDQAIVKSMIELGNTLGLQIIAEGIETEEQAELLRELGCSYVQGYLFGSPTSAANITALLQRSNSPAAAPVP